MKLEPYIILKLFLYFNDFEPQYSYKLYSYEKIVYISFGSQPSTKYVIVRFSFAYFISKLMT